MFGLDSPCRATISAAFLVAAVLLTAAAGCNKRGTAAPVGGADRSPAKVVVARGVEVVRAERRSLDYFVETVGVLEAEGQTEIAAGVSGVVDEVLFREGELVTPQTILLKVDQKRYLSAAEVARAQEARAEATLALARDQASRAQQARAGISEEERTRAILSLKVAEAELTAARASRTLAENNLQKSQVRPPYAGRINQRRVTPGSYIEEKTAIATIADLSRLRLVGWVPETAAATVRELMSNQDQRLRATRISLPLGSFLAAAGWAGPLAAAGLQAADQIPSGFDPEFRLLAFPRQTFRARIFYLSTVANPETHMFECKAELDRRLANVELRPGYTARIKYPLRTTQDACVVPEEAVRASERGFVAFVPTLRTTRGGQEWVAKARTLELGYRAPGWVEIRNGLEPGERIVRRGAESLEDGTPIRFSE